LEARLRCGITRLWVDEMDSFDYTQDYAPKACKHYATVLEPRIARISELTDYEVLSASPGRFFVRESCCRKI